MDGHSSYWRCCWSRSRSSRSGSWFRSASSWDYCRQCSSWSWRRSSACCLMRHEGSRAWKALNDAFTNGKVPTGELADAALILVGGVLLMLPGFLTDIIGFLFLLRWTRPFARKIIAFFVARRINRLGIPVMRARLDRDNLIEGETVETPQTSRRRPENPTIIAGEIEES